MHGTSCNTFEARAPHGTKGACKYYQEAPPGQLRLRTLRGASRTGAKLQSLQYVELLALKIAFGGGHRFGTALKTELVQVLQRGLASTTFEV